MLEVLVHGVVITEETINRYYYHADAFTDPLDDFLDVFIPHVLDPLIAGMSNQAGFTSVQVNTVRGGSSFTSRPITAIGAVGGDCLPPYAAFDFTLVRGGVGERNGYKRIAGVAEASQVNGIPVAGSLAVMNAAAVAMGDTLDVGLSEFRPVIRRDVINHIPQLLLTVFSISSVQFSRIGTQNSRKFGHGR